MIQVYFLSTLCALVGGWMLYKEADAPASFERVTGAGPDIPCRLIAGVACLAAGVLALLSPVDGDVRLIGDLVPAAACLASGLSLVEYHAAAGKEGDGPLAAAYEFLAVNRKRVGVASMVAGALHFLLPRALFL